MAHGDAGVAATGSEAGMRQLTALLIGLTLIVTGCGKPDSSSSGSSGDNAKTVTIWWAEWAPSKGLRELGEDFTKETGIKVEVREIPWSSYQDQVFVNFSQKQTDFDIVVGDSQWIGKCATNKLYLDISDWLPSNVDMKTVHPIALKYLCSYPAGSTKYFAAPCETDAVGFVYRKDWFEDPKEKEAYKAKYKRDLAVPVTWEEFRDIADFFTRHAEKKYGCAILTGREYDSIVMGLQQFIWDWGGQWGDEKTLKVDGYLNTPDAVQGINVAKELMSFSPPGGKSFSYDKTIEAMKNGSVAMAMDYFAFFPDISKSMGDKVGFFIVPKHGNNQFISLGGQGMSISTKVPPVRQENAKKFIAWFLKTENQKKWITKEAGFTANTEILKSDAFRKATPYNAAFADSLDHLRDFWNVPSYNELLGEAVKELGQALDGKDAQAALNDLAKAHEAILKESGN
jgi:multiple sugar transport system substrate-binding protein